MTTFGKGLDDEFFFKVKLKILGVIMETFYGTFWRALE
jgi:hypothetical protein